MPDTPGEAMESKAGSVLPKGLGRYRLIAIAKKLFPIAGFNPGGIAGGSLKTRQGHGSPCPYKRTYF